MNKAYDLTLAALHVSADPKAAEFVKAIQKFKSVVSVSSDLREAKASVDELRDMRDFINERAHIARALLMHAVVTYSRASHTKAIERFNVGVTAAYSQEQKKMHERIVELRDKVLVHFGPGDGWHDERVIYIQKAHGDSITAVHHRIMHDSTVVDTLHHLLEVAIPFVQKRHTERVEELDDILASSPGLFKVIDRLPFDPIKFYESTPGAAENFWAPESFSLEHTVKLTTEPTPIPSRKSGKKRR